MLKLAGLFFVTAILYAAVGFGGGSTYNALLVITGTDFVILPAIALICNIIVVTGGTVRFHSKGLIPWRSVWPLFVLSVPFAWFGGRMAISETTFVLVLGAALMGAALLMIYQARFGSNMKTEKPLGPAIPAIGSAIGLLSGLVGIGGGIFLAPVLHLTKWGRAKVIAGVCSAFILVNSVAGLAGQLTKLEDMSRLGSVASYWPLFVAVFIGGQIGSRAGSGRLNPQIIRVLTALLIFVVGGRLLARAIG